jgi:amino acid transporter
VQGRVRPGGAIISTTNTNLNMIIVIAILLFLILVVLVWGENAATGLMELAALGVVGLIVLVILALLGLEAWDYMQHHPKVRELRDVIPLGVVVIIGVAVFLNFHHQKKIK